MVQKKLTKELLEIVEELYSKKGWGYKKIADFLLDQKGEFISPSTIKRWIKDNKIEKFDEKQQTELDLREKYIQLKFNIRELSSAWQLIDFLIEERSRLLSKIDQLSRDIKYLKKINRILDNEAWASLEESGNSKALIRKKSMLFELFEEGIETYDSKKG